MSANSLVELLSRNPVHLDFAKSQLPSGSGFDAGTEIESISESKIVLATSFHHIDDNGFYCGWSEHKVIVTPSWEGFTIKVTGKDKRNIKEYILDTFYHVLSIRYDIAWNKDEKTFSYKRI